MSQLLGETIDGKYRMDRVIGEGGMGLVLEAMHLQLEQRVAIKVLAGEALKSEEAVARFAREARAAARIQSEHVVRVFDVSTLDNGAPYLVMEYLEGRDLEQTLREEGPLPAADAVTYVLQACEALAEAHTNGIVHRDLKPANLFVAERADGSLRIKILDFGVSKLLPRGMGRDDDPRVTRTMSLMGSPLYMAPELMRGAKAADLRADIWSLGIILYELLAGVAPFEGETLTEVCAAIVADPPQSLAAHRPDLPKGLEEVVLRCLEKEATLRFADVAELAQALAPFAPEQGAISVKRTSRVIERRSLRAPAPSAAAPEETSDFLRRSRRSYRDHRMVATLPEVEPHLRSTVGTFGLTDSGERKRPGLSPHVLLAAVGGAISVLTAVAIMGLVRPSVSEHRAPVMATASTPVTAEPVVVEPIVEPPPAAIASAEPVAKKEPAHRPKAEKASVKIAADAGPPTTSPEEPQTLEYRL
ncbi:protein kinase [Pendulispora brunnea]|uniref:Protein kinase n=1 Tax=Pendulispora brunnea TaxID=2905690 RepID=A0ABZ2KFC7_9BACT